MTVLFVLLTFATFIALDAWHQRRQRVFELAPAKLPLSEAAQAHLEPVWVSGYLVPEGIHYHRGHTWARQIAPDTAVVGLDDFARRLIGPVSRTKLPEPGAWLRSGDHAARLGVGERMAELVSPIEGEVVETNAQLESTPGLASSDPYGRGWLFKIKAPDLARNFGNLFSGTLAHRFFEDAKEKLQLELMALSGSVLADGGEPAADYSRELTDEEWKRLAHEFLLG
ncbi:MAG: glycine cleavage system protein H [Acidobacteria bacterium]|nr:glycine cleavage system protein H [Acidobacteriota bacterium]